jgi:hypothetical protein
MTTNPARPKNETKSDTERRESSRLICQLPVVLSVLMPDESYNPFTTAVFLNNVSERGVKVCCPAPANHWPRKLREGQLARLIVHDGQTRFHLLCTVAWTAPCHEVENQFCYGFGLSFDSDDPGTREGVARLIAKSQTTPPSLKRRTCPVCV